MQRGKKDYRLICKKRENNLKIKSSNKNACWFTGLTPYFTSLTPSILSLHVWNEVKQYR